MTKRKQTSGRQVLAVLALALPIYLMMVLGPLAWITDIAGLPAFDLRPMGYSVAEAEALLTALGEDGRALYLWRQIPLDLIYPALMAAVFWTLCRWLESKSQDSTVFPVAALRFARWLGLVAAASDYSENLGVILMLSAALPLPDIVPFASAATIAKSVLTTGVIALIIAASVAIWRQLMRVSVME